MKKKTNSPKGDTTRAMILEFIITYISNHGYSPTTREIGEGVGLKSSSSVQSHLIRMLADGTIETDAPPGTPRAIRVPGYKFTRDDSH